MKKLILTILTTITIWGVNAQGNNLQFNQVINQDFIGNVDSQTFYIIGTITVDPNKTLKITSFMGFRNDHSTSDIYVKINNMMVISSESGADAYIADTPIWLESGAHTVYFKGAGTVLQPASFSISGIEFNIVQ